MGASRINTAVCAPQNLAAWLVALYRNHQLVPAAVSATLTRAMMTSLPEAFDIATTNEWRVAVGGASGPLYWRFEHASKAPHRLTYSPPHLFTPGLREASYRFLWPINSIPIVKR